MGIQIYIQPITNAEAFFEKLLHSELHIDKIFSAEIYQKRVKKHLDKLKENMFLLAETDYVDKVYRDSYYNYYSSKLTKYERNCIRISLFEGVVELTDFWDNGKRDKLQEQYRGFIIIRPTDPYVV